MFLFSRRTGLLVLGGVLAELAFLGVSAECSARPLLDPGIEVMTLGQAQTAAFDAHRAIANVLGENPNLTFEEAAAIVNDLSASGHALDVLCCHYICIPRPRYSAISGSKPERDESGRRGCLHPPADLGLRPKRDTPGGWLFYGLFFGLVAVGEIAVGQPYRPKRCRALDRGSQMV